MFSNTYAVLMNEKQWTDPNEFRPERFLNADGSVDKKKAEIAKIVFLPGRA